MPCTPKRARLLLARKRAVVHRVQPFVIRLKDRHVGDCVLQPIALKIDPGSKTTGIALARVEATEEGQVHRALFLAEVWHRGHTVHDRKVAQANARRRRRSTNLRHRVPRFDHRKLPEGWLPPSILSRVGNVVTWAHRLIGWSPVSRLEVERVCFDTQLLQHPEIEGVQYQHGELAGWEVRAYLLIKYAYPGGRTRWNRARFGVGKTHALDALCVGDLAGVRPGTLKTLAIKASGRGDHCRTNWTKQGFPRGYKMRQKQVRGFKTGDRVRAVIPTRLKTAGIHVGRVQVRTSGSFDIQTREREVEGVNAKYCSLVQRADGYAYAISERRTSGESSILCPERETPAASPWLGAMGRQQAHFW
jgi:RRXRR protein